MDHLPRIILFLSWNLLFLGTITGQAIFADCSDAKVLCDKNTIFINELAGHGNLAESAPGSCFREDFEESNSLWLKWKIAEAGILNFTILPLNEADDIDFVLFRLNTLEDCSDKELLRCMAAGPNLGNENSTTLSCTGATGLRSNAIDSSQSYGCKEGGNNFLSPIEVKSGECYALFINNFRAHGGILIEWGGSETFQQIPEKCALSGSTTAPTLNNGNLLQLSAPFPDPVSQVVSIQVYSAQELNGQLQVISSNGQVEMTRPFKLLSGSNMLELPVENLRKGVHFVKFQTGIETHILRFVKQ